MVDRKLVYALGAEPGLPRRKTKAELLEALEGRVLGRAELIGTYQRE